MPGRITAGLVAVAAIGGALGVNVAIDRREASPRDRSEELVRNAFAERGAEVRGVSCTTHACEVELPTGESVSCAPRRPVRCDAPVR